MPHTATLVFTVVAANQPAVNVEAAVQAVPPPYELLTALGIFVTSDATTGNAEGTGRTVAQRTMVLQLDATTPMQVTFQNNGQFLTGVTLTNPGSCYGGQPVYNVDGLNGEQSENSASVQVLMELDAVHLNQGGAGYTAPTVTFEGATVEGGTQALGHATFALGAITAVVIDNPGAGYCMAPIVVIHDPTGSGAQAMACLKGNAVNITSPGGGATETGGNGDFTNTPEAGTETMFPAGPIPPTAEAFDMVAGPVTDLASRAAIVAALMQASLHNATSFPVKSVAPVIT